MTTRIAEERNLKILMAALALLMMAGCGKVLAQGGAMISACDRPGHCGVGHWVPSQEPPQFDEPPKEWNEAPKDHRICTQSGYLECVDVPNGWKQHHRACSDKSRFLLMSEDGKWHCLALAEERR